MSRLLAVLRRKQRPPTLDEITLVATHRLLALYASQQCHDDPELLVAVWSELRLRKTDLRALSERTIHWHGGRDDS
jgi:hypothetical protein